MSCSIPADQKPIGGLRPLIGGVLAFGTAIGIGRFAYTPILLAMERGAHLTIDLAGVLASVNYAGYLIGALLAAAIPVGPLHRRLVLGSLVAVILTTVLMAETTHVVVWAGIRLFSGIASAGVFVLAGGMVLDILRREGRTAWSGWLFGGVGVGIATSGVVVRAVNWWEVVWLSPSLRPSSSAQPL